MFKWNLYFMYVNNRQMMNRRCVWNLHWKVNDYVNREIVMPALHSFK